MHVSLVSILVHSAVAVGAPPGSLPHAFLSQLLTPSVGLIVTLVVILVAQYVRSPWRKVPPGPKGFPVLGNVLQFRDRGWMFEGECKQKFGTSDLGVFFPQTP